jgi:hypothetical protein
VRSGLDGRDPKSPGHKAACELTAAAADLEHPITAYEARDPAGTVDELIGMRRTVAVVFGGDFVEQPAVPPRGSDLRHVRHARERLGRFRREMP